MQADKSMYELKIGESAPNFTLQGTDNTYSLEDFKKDHLVIVFMCNHCPYVLAYIDRIVQLAKDFPQVDFVGINANDPVQYPQDSFAHMQRFVRERGVPFPYLFDETQEVAKAYHGLLTPHVMVFDKERKLVYNGGIDDNWQNHGAVVYKYLRDALTALVAGKKPPVQETPCVGCSIKWKE